MKESILNKKIREDFTENKHLRWMYFGRTFCAKGIETAKFPRWKTPTVFEEQQRALRGWSAWVKGQVQKERMER